MSKNKKKMESLNDEKLEQASGGRVLPPDFQSNPRKYMNMPPKRFELKSLNNPANIPNADSRHEGFPQP